MSSPIEQSKSGEANQSPANEDFLEGDVHVGHYETEQSAPLVDEGTGKLTILRRFDFALPPKGSYQYLPKEKWPTEENLLSFYRPHLLAFLWRDELEPIEEFKIRIAKDYLRFRIKVKCQAKKGSLILTKPKLLQEVANPHALKRDRVKV